MAKPKRDARGRLVAGTPSLNPGGRRSAKPITEADIYLGELTLEQLDALDPKKLTATQAARLAMLRAALDGDVQAAREIADRVQGKPTQPIEASATDEFWKEAAELAAGRVKE